MSTKTVRVDMGDRGYDIRIGSGWELGEAVRSFGGRSCLIVSDGNVDPLYGDRLQSILAGSGVASKRYLLKAGEQSKSIDSLHAIYNAALDAGLDRKGVIFALGGGMVGDVAGFAAATFMRGIGFVQVPTSLLAMVDSSVGGKTAVNLPRGKNLIGCFYQPVEVVVSLDALTTLPDREFSAGMAEVVKYGVIWDAEFFGFIEHNIDAIMARDSGVLAKIVARCCEIKAEVVAVDEKESGVRSILNFGHTLAHSLENLCGYGECIHGEAVAIGMAYAARLSVLALDLDHSVEARIRTLLVKCRLPVSVMQLKKRVDWKSVRSVMNTDKKTMGSIPRFVLAERLGAVRFGCAVDESVLQGAYEAMIEEDAG